VDRPPEEPAPEEPAPEEPDARADEWAPSEGEPAADPPASLSYPPVPPAPVPIPPIPPGAGVQPGAKDDRPGVGPGIATGCGLQVLAFVLFSLTAGVIGTFFGLVWPFVLVTVASAGLMFSRRWRRFATGALIVCAATWIIVIGPCIALLQPYV
jgi:hypothetical protein